MVLLKKHFYIEDIVTVALHCGTRNIRKNAGRLLRLIDFIYLGSAAGPVIQENGRLTFEADLRSGGLLYYTVNQYPH